MSAIKQPMQQQMVLLTPGQRATLKAIKAKTGIPVGAQVRHAVDQWIAKHVRRK